MNPTEIPEFLVQDSDKMNKNAPGQFPVLKFHTHLTNEELLPMPNDHSLKHSEMMY